MFPIFSFLRLCYEKTIRWAEHPYNVFALSFFAFIESIFFPIPPDALLVPMGISQPRRALYFAFFCSLFSILGGVLAYFLGQYFWASMESLFLGNIISVEAFEKVAQMYESNVFWVISVAAFTPIPFKVFTLAAGVFDVSFREFFIGMFLGRPARFFLLGFAFFFFGEKIRYFLDKYFNFITILITILLLGGVFAVKWIF